MWSSPVDFHRRAHCRGAALNISKKSRFGERVAEPVTDDEVIEHPDIQERQRFLQAPRNELIRLAGLEHPGRMVVRKNQYQPRQTCSAAIGIRRFRQFELFQGISDILTDAL